MNSLGFREIRAWRKERDLPKLLPWQMDAILAMDMKRRSVEAEKVNVAVDEPKAEVSKRTLTSRLFDTLFASKVK